MKRYPPVLALVLLHVPTAVAMAQTEDRPALSGVVLDFRSDDAVAGARVELLDAWERRLASTIADSAGQFVFERVRPGVYRLRAHSLGYRVVITPNVNVTNDPVDVIVRLSADAVPLAPLEVVTRATPPRAHINHQLSEFFARAESKRGGTFIMREEIETRRPIRVTDLLKTVGSMTVTSQVLVNMRGNCAPAIFLDGVRIAAGGSGTGSYEAANSVDPLTLEGIEVYRGPATTPAQFAGFYGACGAVALWSRR